MCMAIYKPKGGDFPDKKTLSYIWSKNSDGAGYMVIEKEVCHITKGFLTFKDFWAHLQTHPKIKDASTEVILHFRYGTSGSIDATCTHPFPITQDTKELKTSVITCNQAVVHNGVFGNGEGELSDTMTFVRDTLFPLRKYFSDPEIIQYIEKETVGNRLAIVSHGTVYLTGDWKKYKGIFYSDRDYKPKEKKKKKKKKKNSRAADIYRSYYDLGKAEKHRSYTGDVLKQSELSTEHEVFGETLPYCPHCGLKVYVSNYYNSFLCIACGVEFDAWGSQDLEKDISF